MQRSHKIQLKPNQKAVEYFQQACGTARFVFNWGLAEWNRQYREENGHPSGLDLKRYFNSFKYEEFPWLKEIHRDAASQPFTNLHKAFTNFFAGTSRYPKPKKKHKSRDSFYLANDKFSIQGKYIRIPKFGMVKMTEKLRLKGKILGATVSRRADKWFVSIQVELNEPIVLTDMRKPSIGIDFGIATFAYLSDGTPKYHPRIFKQFEGKLRRLNKSLSRKVKFSNNWKKAKQKLQILHKRIADSRLDFTHKFTHFTATNYGVVCIEDLNIKGMLANHKLAKHVQDISLHETRRQLEYKCVEVHYCGRFEPSSKTCHQCDWKNENLTLKDREFKCQNCGGRWDRDFNAAQNILRWATPKVKSVDRKALARGTTRRTKPAGVKQK